MKLGGSLLTDKSTYRTPRVAEIARLAHEIPRDEPIVIVHGAGSYGHVLAKESDLASGNGTLRNFAQVHGDVRELTGFLLTALRGSMPAVSIATYDVARLRDGKLAAFAGDLVADTLRAGLVPVLSGDVALDSGRRWGVLSGDVLMIELARMLRPERAVFATDVDGIHASWPDGPLLERIGPDDRPFATGSAGIDITGGMAGKLERARHVARFAGEVRVVNGKVPGRVQDALLGKETFGTTVAG